MTIREFSELLDVSVNTATRAAKALYPERFDQGKAAVFTLNESKRIIESIKHRGQLAQNGEVLPQNGEVIKPESMMSMLRQAADVIEAQQKALQIAAPKVETYHAICDSTNLKSVGEVAKIIGTGRNRLFEMLRVLGVIDSRNIPYQQYIEQGYFEVKDTAKQIGGESVTFPVTFFTGKGEVWISEKIRKSVKRIADGVGK